MNPLYAANSLVRILRFVSNILLGFILGFVVGKLFSSEFLMGYFKAFFGMFLVFFFFSPGVIHADTNPVFRAVLSTTATSTTNNYVIPFDDVIFDVDSGYSTTTYRYTMGNVGYYRVSWQVTCNYALVATFSICETRGRKNTVAQTRALGPYASAPGASTNQSKGSYLAQSDGDDYIEIFQVSTGASDRPTFYNTSGYTHLDIEYVGDIPEVVEAVEPPITYYDWLIVVMLFLFINSIPMWLYFTSNMYPSRSRPKNTW